jgi:hypothetical protein
MGHAEDDIGPYSQDAETGRNDSQDQLIVKPIKTWKGYVWDTWELPKDQRWLLFKLDAFVLTFASVSSLSVPNPPILGNIFKEHKLPNTELLRLDTSSRTSILVTSTMPFSAAWRRTCKCTETSS